MVAFHVTPPRGYRIAFNGLAPESFPCGRPIAQRALLKSKVQRAPVPCLRDRPLAFSGTKCAGNPGQRGKANKSLHVLQNKLDATDAEKFNGQRAKTSSAPFRTVAGKSQENLPLPQNADRAQTRHRFRGRRSHCSACRTRKQRQELLTSVSLSTDSQRIQDITAILDGISRGEAQSTDELLPLVYEELRKLAAARMIHQPADHTLQATALVHEAYLRLVGGQQIHWNSRGHFFSAAAEAMRRILVERARRKAAARHGGGLQRLNLDEVNIALDTKEDVILALSEALVVLREKDATSAELINLRFFAGLPNRQAAELLGLSERTAKRTWAYARAWLYERLRKKSSE